jgi:hypothetical protein
LGNGRQPQLLQKWNKTSIFFGIEQLQLFQMEDDLNNNLKTNGCGTAPGKLVYVYYLPSVKYQKVNVLELYIAREANIFLSQPNSTSTRVGA